METTDIKQLRTFAEEVHSLEKPEPRNRLVKALENFGRVRLSEHFFMRDFLYSETSAVHGIPNIPDDPLLAIEAGKGLCRNLLEPLRDTFGHIVVRSAFRSTTVNGYCNAHRMNCARNSSNYGKHIWDARTIVDECVGATACIVIPRFIDSQWYKDRKDWQPLAWFIHDHEDYPYSEMCFFPINAAFNLTWREKNPIREIRYYPGPPGGRVLTKPGYDNYDGDHSEYYIGRLGV